MGGGEPAVVALIPDDRIHVRFFVPEQAVAAYRPGTRGSASAATAARTASPRRSPMSARGPNSRRRSSTAARRATGSCSWSRRGLRTAPGSSPACRSTSCRSACGRDRRDRRRRAEQVVRRPARGQGLLDPGRGGPDHRLPRPQRLGQDDDAAHALRPADARQRRAAPRLGFDIIARELARSSAAPAT